MVLRESLRFQNIRVVKRNREKFPVNFYHSFFFLQYPHSSFLRTKYAEKSYNLLLMFQRELGNFSKDRQGDQSNQV